MKAVDDALVRRLEDLVPGGVRARATDRLALAHDASHYLLTPQAVVAPADVAQLSALLRAAREDGLALTFRSGGTSLSGQGGTDGVLVDTRRHFRDIEVLDDGRRVRVQPGATVREVNTRLAPFGTKLGPDPASESACTIGGVVANNSSGMACGTELNTYRTLDSMVLLLPSGTVVDTAQPDADDRLRWLEPDVHDGLCALRDRVRGDAGSVATIERLFALKNTMGYSVNAFLDHTRAVDVLAHLVIGSEGTLAFVAEATFRTVPVAPHVATGLLLFPGLRAANDALPALVGTGAAIIELLDAQSLRVAQVDPQADASLRDLQVHEHAALLVEFQDLSAQELADRSAAAEPLLRELNLSEPVRFTSEPRARAALWHIRKGLYATVAGARPSGTTALLEDIAVPLATLGETCGQLSELFTRHGYEQSVIFGHAKDGNVHFLLNERFGEVGSSDRYVAFTEDMVELVLGRGGTLKAEHGTGRIMAPFVRRQYGDELYDVMRAVKLLCDPHGVLNPGILINDDPFVHVQNLKVTPRVEQEVDRCVECGYCEPVCPSKDLTLTPRQRIVLRRERADAQANGDDELVRQLDDEYDYDGMQTCAADGMCQTACPVLIDTGLLVKRLRAEQNGRGAQLAWKQAAKHWDGATRAAARALDTAAALPDPLVVGASSLARRVLGADVVPAWTPDLPRGGRRRRPLAAGHPQAVYLPSCTGSMFAPAPGHGGVGPAFIALCERAGVEVVVPKEVAGLCCGTPWKSKGLLDGYDAMRRQVLPVLQRASDDGRLPVVCDAASCTEGLHDMLDAAPALSVVDATTFVATHVMPFLTVRRGIPVLALHPTCSTTRLALNDDLRALAAAIADEVVVPDTWSCCAFAGDRGMLHPEFTASATRRQAAEVRAADADAHASANRTCEVGMARATGENYRHLLELLDEATR